MIANLKDNAQHYAEGAVAVRLDLEGPQLAVNVDDAGAGIPDDAEHEQVFERFFRGRAAHDRGMARGTGLGLALVRDHVRAFGGTITVCESPDGGARFQILLPIVTSEEDCRRVQVLSSDWYLGVLAAARLARTGIRTMRRSPQMIGPKHRCPSPLDR